MSSRSLSKPLHETLGTPLQTEVPGLTTPDPSPRPFAAPLAKALHRPLHRELGQRQPASSATTSDPA